MSLDYKEAFDLYAGEHLKKVFATQSYQNAIRFGGEPSTIHFVVLRFKGLMTALQGMTPLDFLKCIHKLSESIFPLVYNNGGWVHNFTIEFIELVFGENASCTSVFDSISSIYSIMNEYSKTESFLSKINLASSYFYGEVIYLNYGTSKRMFNDIIGENVDLARKLCGLCDYYGVTNISILSQVENSFTEKQIRKLDTIKISGTKKNYEVCEVCQNVSSREELDCINLFNKGVTLFKKKEWAKAILIFEKVLSNKKIDLPSQRYIKTCRQLIDVKPPNDWDGVFSF